MTAPSVEALLRRVERALLRHLDGGAPRRIPADDSDSDVLLTAVRAALASASPPEPAVLTDEQIDEAVEIGCNVEDRNKSCWYVDGSILFKSDLRKLIRELVGGASPLARSGNGAEQVEEQGTPEADGSYRCLVCGGLLRCYEHAKGRHGSCERDGLAPDRYAPTQSEQS